MLLNDDIVVYVDVYVVLGVLCVGFEFYCVFL